MLRWAPLVPAFCCLTASALQIRTGVLPAAIHGQPYQAQIEVLLDDRCVKADVSFTQVSGRLPEGLTLTTSGLSGTPEEMGHFRFTVRAANECVSTVKALDMIVTAKPVLEVPAGELTFEYHAGGEVPRSRTVLVGSTWPNLPYSISIDAAWLRAAPASGVTPDPGSPLSGDLVTVGVNPDKLAPGTYKAKLVFRTWMGANAPEIPVALKVE